MSGARPRHGVRLAGHVACVLAALLAVLSSPLGADDSRERLRRLRPQPLAPAAADPRAAATRLAETDPRFAPLIATHGAAWREALARRAHELGQRLRVDPLEISRPDIELPDWEWPRTEPTPETASGGGFGLDALIADWFPAIPWRNLAASRPWFRTLTLPRIPWQGLVAAPRRATPRAATPPPAVTAAPPPTAPEYGVPWHGLVRYARPRAAPPSSAWFPTIPWQGLVHAPPVTTRSHPDPTAWTFDRIAFAIVLGTLALAVAYCAIVGLAVCALRWLGSPRAKRLLTWLAGWLPGPLWRTLLRWARAAPEPVAPARVAGRGPTGGITAASMPVAVVLPPVPAGPAWDARAAALFAEGRTREALRELLLLVLAVLDGRGWIRYDAALTNWDYRRQLPAGPARDHFGGLCRLFDRAWYGEQDVDAAAYARATALADLLREVPR